MQKRKQMKIAIDCRLIGQSGIGTYIQNLVAHAVNISGNSYVLIGNIHALESYAQRPNCIVVDCRHKSFTLQELFSYPTKEVNRCDAFFTPNFNIPWGIRVPIFSTIHDVVFFDVDGICSPLGKLIRWMYIKRALGISKTVLTVSHFSEERIRSLFNYRGDVQVVYNGIGQELKPIPAGIRMQGTERQLHRISWQPEEIQRHQGPDRSLPQSTGYGAF